MATTRKGAKDGGFGQLLLTTARLLDERAQARLNAAGEHLARPALMRLLPFLDHTGVRPTDLARRVDVSKQAVGQTLAELERRGFVEYIEDPTDGRARLVRLSRVGAAAVKRGSWVFAALEAELRSSVGARRLGAATEALRAIRHVLEAEAAAAEGKQ
ncbi:MAG: MarR family winged helix-turn-helix transcriptional regulator [Gemmatimonadaceae bacterium]